MIGSRARILSVVPTVSVVLMAALGWVEGAAQEPAASQPAAQSPAAPESVPDADLIRKAQDIVRTYTPQKTVWVRAFNTGLRVVGVSVDKLPDAAEDGPAKSFSSDVTLPGWLDETALLGKIEQGIPIEIRLLWKVEPTLQDPPSPQEFTLKLVHHQGYTQQVQQESATVVRLDNQPSGTVFWTRHSFPAFSDYPPGLYDIYVSGAALPAETIPLGQMLLSPWIRPRDDVASKLRSLFPSAAFPFAGSAVLDPWYQCRFPVTGLNFKPRTLIIVSSADWLEEEPDLTDVATVTVVDASGAKDTHPLKLGRDTASTWYNLHARGGVKHSLATVAWSSNVRRDTVDFDANVYVAKFDLAPGIASPTAVEVAYSGDKGVLRLRGIVLAP